MQISNNSIFIQFGRGPAGGEIFDVTPELYQPVVGSIFPSGGFDAFRWWAATPAAQIPAGQTQAFVVLIPRL